MTANSSNLLQQLADLRVEPPENGFSARLRLELDREAARMGAQAVAEPGPQAAPAEGQTPGALERGKQAALASDNVISLGARRARKEAPLRLKKPLLWLAVAMVLVSGGAAAWVGPARLVRLFSAAPAQEPTESEAPRPPSVQSPKLRSRLRPAPKPQIERPQPAPEVAPEEPAVPQLEVQTPRETRSPLQSVEPGTPMRQRLSPRPQAEGPSQQSRDRALQQLSLPQQERVTGQDGPLARKPAPKQLKLKLDRLEPGSEAQQGPRPAAKLKQRLQERKRVRRELNGPLKQRTRPSQDQAQTLRQRIQDQRQRRRERRNR